MAKQNRTWEFDLEEGVLDAARLSQVIIDPINPRLSKKRDEISRYCSDVANRRLDRARSFYHDRGNVDILENSGTLLRKSRNPRVYNPCMANGESRKLDKCR